MSRTLITMLKVKCKGEIINFFEHYCLVQWKKKKLEVGHR